MNVTFGYYWNFYYTFNLYEYLSSYIRDKQTATKMSARSPEALRPHHLIEDQISQIWN